MQRQLLGGDCAFSYLDDVPDDIFVKSREYSAPRSLRGPHGESRLSIVVIVKTFLTFEVIG